MRFRLAFFLSALALAPSATAHVPGTAIGQAVLALRDVPVSYENGAAVSELEADAFVRLPGVGDGIYVAAMSAAALSEQDGGPDRIAREIAREAGLRGTLVVLAGQRLGAWSDEISRRRLDMLVSSATGTPAARVVALVASVNTEPKQEGGGASWAVLVAAAAVALAAAGLTSVILRRRRARAASSRS
jgi:hypothetical protein